MKNKKIISSLLALALLFIACDEKEWVSRDTELVPVYTLTGFAKSTPLKQDVYQTKPVMIEFKTATQLSTYDMPVYNSNPTDTSYVFNYTLVMDLEIDNGVDTIIQTLVKQECFVNAVKDTINTGTIKYINHYKYDTVTVADMETAVGSITMIDSVFTPINIEVQEDEKYYVVE